MDKKIGFFVNNWIFGSTALKEVIARISKIGYDGIELVGEPEEYDLKEVNLMCRNHGIRIASICGMHPGPKKGDLRALCHPETAERKKAVDYVKRCVDMAKTLGTRSVLVVPSLVGEPAFFVNRKEDLNRAAESLAQAGKYAEKMKIMLMIEPINRYEVGLVNSLEEAVLMAGEINNPCVRVMGDTFHMQIEEGDGIPNAIRRAGNYWFNHLHCADNTRQAPGKGTMDWKEIIRALYDIDYRGVMSLEPLPKGASPYDARKGNIPKEKMDAELSFALKHLRGEEGRIVAKSF
ncbi:MAG: sugar phosphate isomerase/epimerase family protein [Candidatus Omnitrophota bacterium]